MWCIAVCYTKSWSGLPFPFAYIPLFLSLSIWAEKGEIYIYCRQVGRRRFGPTGHQMHLFTLSPAGFWYSQRCRAVYLHVLASGNNNQHLHPPAWAHKPSSPWVCVCVRFSSCRRKITLTHTHRQRLRKLGGDGERHRQRAGKLCQLPKGHDHLGWRSNIRECTRTVYLDIYLPCKHRLTNLLSNVYMF
jgi:hypothetical protein